jgi:hypothetical protein
MCLDQNLSGEILNMDSSALRRAYVVAPGSPTIPRTRFSG